MNDRPDVRQLHYRLGKVNHQPVSVHSYTNKRFTINYRAPLDRLRPLVPPPMELEEIGTTGLGLISQCVCDFNIVQLGPVPIPPAHTNEMLCRISVRIPKNGRWYRAYYTLRSDTSSRMMGFLGGNFSHFRKAISQFTLRDDGDVYALTCRARDSLCDGRFEGDLHALSKEKPDTTIFADVKAATDFIYELDGSAGYSYSLNMLSFQKIDYPAWDIYFCHQYDYDFGLLNYLFKAYELDAELDCVLFMEKVPQVWNAAWMYRPDPKPAVRHASASVRQE